MERQDEAATESTESPEAATGEEIPAGAAQEPAVEEAGAMESEVTEPPEEGAPDPGQTAAEIAALGAALETTRKELSESVDRRLRLAAEFDNYRKRTERERTESWGRAQADVVGRLLDVLDDLERVAHFDESASAAALLEGVQLVDKKLRQVLEAAGLAVVDAEGAIFDPNTMEGLATVEAESSEEDDRVSDVFQKGYVFKGQLLRPARVRVKQYEG